MTIRFCRVSTHGRILQGNKKCTQTDSSNVKPRNLGIQSRNRVKAICEGEIDDKKRFPEGIRSPIAPNEGFLLGMNWIKRKGTKDHQMINTPGKK